MSHQFNPMKPHPTVFTSQREDEAAKMADALRGAGLHPLIMYPRQSDNVYRVDVPDYEFKPACEILAAFEHEIRKP